jgi:hypothetical protein
VRKFVAPIVVVVVAIIVVAIVVQIRKSGEHSVPQIAPGSRLVTIVPITASSGGDYLPTFTIPSNAGAWALGWSYNCGAYGDGKGNFMVLVLSADGATTSNAPVNQTGAVGDSVSYYYDTGSFRLLIKSECSWHVKVTATEPK